MKNLQSFEDFVNESYLNEAAETTGVINWLRKELISANIYGEEAVKTLNYKFKKCKFVLEFEIQEGPNLTDFTVRQYTALAKPKFLSFMEKYARGFGDTVMTLGLSFSENAKINKSVYPAFATEDKETMVKIIDELVKPMNPSLAEKALTELNAL